MVWGKGGLLNAFAGRKHPLASISPAARWCTSPRAFPRWSARCIWASAWAIRTEPMKPHSLVLSFIGACLLWVGWFGFNAGSALAAHPAWPPALSWPPISAAAAAALGWMLAEWMHNGQAQHAGRHLRRCGGTGRDHSCLRIRQADPGLADRLRRRIGLLLHGDHGEEKFGYDDSLDAFGVHGAGGTLGAILTGVFATNAVNDGLKDAAGKPFRLGWVDGNAGQVLNQVIGMRDCVGAGDCRHADHSEDLRRSCRLAGECRAGDARARFKHARGGGLHPGIVAGL